MNEAPLFFDTNVLIYAFDTSDPAKTAVAQNCLREAGVQRTGVISVQVMGEFYHVLVVRKRALPGGAVADIFDRLDLRVQPVDRPLVGEAFAMQARFGIGYWDSLMLVTARRAGCRVVLSEDLNPDQDYDGVVVRNPFAEAAPTVQHRAR